MSNVDWDLEKCEAKTTAVLDGDCDDLAGIVAKVATLKLDQNLSSIYFEVPNASRCDEFVKKVIGSLADLLKANPSIKSLQVNSTDSTNGHAREYLLQVLADGITGDSLEHLWLDDTSGKASVEETVCLVRYLTRNQNLTRLRFDVTGGPGMQLVSCLPTSVRNLCLDIWQYRDMGELGATLGQCSSILSLKLNLYDGDHPTEVESFFQSIPEMHCLTHLEIDFNTGSVPSPEMIDAIGSLITRQRTLAHVHLDAYCYEEPDENWKDLGLALCSVKSVSLCFNASLKGAVLAVLPQLQSCESLAFDPCGEEIRPFAEVASRLPNLRDVIIDATYSDVIHDDILDMIKTSNSIATVHFIGTTISAAFQGSVESFCILNRAFGTNLIGFGPTDLWAHILSKVSDGSARAILLHRLLREKPEMIVSNRTQSSVSSYN